MPLLKINDIELDFSCFGFLSDSNIRNDKVIQLSELVQYPLKRRNPIPDIKAMIHSSVNEWKENILVAESEEFIIRIDGLADNSLRYVSWSKPKSISEKPDLILLNGNQEFQGTAGCILYTFKNSNWTYLIDQRDICADDEDCGLFLELFLNDQEKSKLRLNEIK